MHKNRLKIILLHMTRFLSSASLSLPCDHGWALREAVNRIKKATRHTRIGWRAKGVYSARFRKRVSSTNVIFKKTFPVFQLTMDGCNRIAL